MKILTHTLTDQLTDARFLFDGSDYEFTFIQPELITEFYAEIERDVKAGAIISNNVFEDLQNFAMLKFHFSKHYPNKVTNLF